MWFLYSARGGFAMALVRCCYDLRRFAKTSKQTNAQTINQTNKLTNKQTTKHTNQETNKQTHKQTNAGFRVSGFQGFSFKVLGLVKGIGVVLLSRARQFCYGVGKALL